MDVKQNFNRLSDETREYVNLRVDSTKLYLVEVLSQFTSDMLSRMLFFLFLFISFLFVLVAVMFLLAPAIGLVSSAFAIAVFLLLVAAVIYFTRKFLFTNIMIARLCSMFFPKNDVDDETN